MEGITEIDKTEYIDECKEIVRNEIPEELSDEMLTIVTNEIMDTCLFIGGDFKKENIIDITEIVKGVVFIAVFSSASAKMRSRRRSAGERLVSSILIFSYSRTLRFFRFFFCCLPKGFLERLHMYLFSPLSAHHNYSTSENGPRSNRI